MRDISLYLSTIPDYNQMLAGKNVLITTAARGIGKSIALLFARQGRTSISVAATKNMCAPQKKNCSPSAPAAAAMW